MTVHSPGPNQRQIPFEGPAARARDAGIRPSSIPTLFKPNGRGNLPFA